MPRQARSKSETGIYHIMLRGINQQQIFEDDEDRSYYLESLRQYQAESGYSIFAFCLMGNYVHLLMKEGAEPLSTVFKRLGGKYVYYFNGKYGRAVHLFQDRFKSEAVEDDGYFMTVLRYIHQNPVKAGFSMGLEYPWSSYESYTNGKEGLVDIQFAFSLMEKKEFVRYHEIANDDACLDITPARRRVTDDQARELIAKYSKCKNATQVQELSGDQRSELLVKLRDEGLSIRQTSRLTGIPFGIVRKWWS